jgi:hypothetical protein
VRPAYNWPLKPFDRQHPVRAFLNDPRIGRHGVRSFHFGIDIAARDGTAVYAVEAGTVYLSHDSVAVAASPRHGFGYWHVKPAAGLEELDVVSRHQLLGTVEPGWKHVHFAERVDGVFVNPLRPGGVGPYTDPLPPTVAGVSLVEHGGAIVVLASGFDTTWPLVPGPWADEPVAPALLRWRVRDVGRPFGEWRTAVDLSSRMLERGRFESVYAPPTEQNHQGEPGLYWFYIERSWKPADGVYELEVEASDSRDNRADARLEVRIEHGRLRR